MSGSLSKRVRLGRHCVSLVMVVLLVAAVLKLTDVTAFARDLGKWELLPKSTVPLLGVMIPCLELGVGLAWFLGMARRRTAALGFLLLFGFSALYAAHVAMGSPPDCACFGKFLEFKATVADSWKVLVRNGVLLAVLGLGMVLIRKGPQPEVRPA